MQDQHSIRDVHVSVGAIHSRIHGQLLSLFGNLAFIFAQTDSQRLHIATSTKYDKCHLLILLCWQTNNG